VRTHLDCPQYWAYWRLHLLRGARLCGRIWTTGDCTCCEELACADASGLSTVLATCVATVLKGRVRACVL